MSIQAFQSGTERYHERGRRALPLLVRQAHAGQPITYSDLAELLAMPNARNLNYVLGTIGEALQELRLESNDKVPSIQFLVIGKGSQVPGAGIATFIAEKNFSELPKAKRKAIFEGELSNISAYPRWNEILKRLGLEPLQTDFSPLIADAQAFRAGGGGESDAHKALKAFVASQPELLGLRKRSGPGQQEYRLASGDAIDVLFEEDGEMIAAEVKSSISTLADITRGLFQCVKYRAVLEAQQTAKSQHRHARAVLVLEKPLPLALTELRQILGIKVIQVVLSPT